MALQKFRDKQKMIYWIVAIVVVPSFVLLGFTGAFMTDGSDQTIGSYFGKKCSLNQYEQFQRRVAGLNRYNPPILVTADPQSGQFRPYCDERISTFLMMAFIEDARRHGVQVTDEEVGTFIRTQINYTGTNPREFRDRIQRELDSRSIPLGNVFEYQQAVREVLLARKFLALIDNSIIIPRTFAEVLFAQQKTEYTYKHAFISAESQNAAAAEEIGKLSEAELFAKAEDFIKTNQIPANRRRYTFLWEQPQWRLDYIFVPFEVPSREPKITDEKVQMYYDAHKNNYKNDKGEVQELAAVKTKVEADLRRDERAQNAQNTIKREVDDFLRRRDKNAAEQDAMTAATVAELNADPRLASLALKAGTTSNGAKTIEEIFAEEPLKSFAMSASFVFSALDRQLTDKADKAAAAKDAQPKDADKAIEDFLAPYKKVFRGQSFGQNAADTPLSSDVGLLKFRIVEYVPGNAKKLRGVDGQPNTQFLAAIKNTLIEQLAMRKAEKLAAEVQTALKEGKTPAGGVEVKQETADYFSMGTRALFPLCSAVPGTVPAPVAQMYPKAGYEVVQLVSVKIPDTAQMGKEIDASLRNVTMNSRSNQAYAPEGFATPWIMIGNRVKSYINDNVVNGKIVLGPALTARSDDMEE